MSGLMQRYNESLAKTPGPISLNDMPKVVIDYRALAEYIREKGINTEGLTNEEKCKFIISGAEALNKSAW